MNRLMLGSGIFKREGWKTLDCNPLHNPNFVATIPPLPDAVRQTSWQEVEWIHGITSLYPWDAEIVLKELHEVIQSGGRLCLEQPDYGKAREKVEWVFGDGVRHHQPLLMNRWAYTPESLERLLAQIGFWKISIMPAQFHVPERDFRVEAWR